MVKKNIPEENIPEENIPEENIPGENIPEENIPEETEPPAQKQLASLHVCNLVAGGMTLAEALKKTVCCIAVIVLVGCTTNIRMTDIKLKAGRDQMVDASGATNTTDTGQISQADLSSLVDAAKAVISDKTASIIDKVKDVIEDQGAFEVIE